LRPETKEVVVVVVVVLPLLPMRRSMLGDFDLGDVVVVVLFPGGGLMTMCKSGAKMFFHSVI
jgi:hypothetical protein